MMSTIAAISGTATTSRRESVTSSLRAMITPPTIMIGAAAMIVSAICRKIWICWTSLVLRVMREAVPKLFISRAEKRSTWPNTAARRSRPTPIEVREAKYVATTAIRPCTRVSASIRPPVRQMYETSPLAMPLLMMSAVRLGRYSPSTVWMTISARTSDTCIRYGRRRVRIMRIKLMGCALEAEPEPGEWWSASPTRSRSARIFRPSSGGLRF